MPKRTKTASGKKEKKEKAKRSITKVTKEVNLEDSKTSQIGKNISDDKNESKKEDKYELVIAEKPKAAFKIASALSTTPIKKKNYLGVPYYEISINGKRAVVAAGVGHLYTLLERGGNKWKYPVFDVEWVPIFKAQKKASYTKKYIELLKKLGENASEVTVATDYDIEGEVIGLNIVRFILGRNDANRMKFSTLTPSDLKNAYDEKSRSIDWGQANAGEARHIMDYFYGINVSRALTSSLKTAGKFSVLSSGRVQGPALKIIYDREKEIMEFSPKKYWQLFLKAKNNKSEIVEALHEKEKFWDNKEAIEAKKRAEKGEPFVEEVDYSEIMVQPPTPFDLTTLQTEAYRCFKINPKRTLDIAQELYTEGLISYPRTSSQKLPVKIGFRSIIEKLAEQKNYNETAKELLSKDKLYPREGKKQDPAHPAIYPTGFAPKKLSAEESKIYDLIVKRFFSVFGNPIKKLVVKIKINSNEERFLASGSVIRERGWLDYYRPYYNISDKIIPRLEKNEKLFLISISIKEDQTKPKPRYNQASLVAELTRKNLGTKATRAQIVDTLFNRNYIKGEQITLTKLGEATVETLLKYSPTILDENLTRHFEEELEMINQNKKEKTEVLEEAKQTVNSIISDFKKNENSIGIALKDAHKETEMDRIVVGKCPNCKEGNLIIIRSKKTGKQFIACDQYPNCKTTFSLPQYGLIKTTKEKCPLCGFPIVNVIRKGKKPWKLCINPDCPSKKNWNNKLNNNGNNNDSKNNDAKKKQGKQGQKRGLKES
ncbi:MAG: DNA topoisomerase I [Candidatus Woesearchaeota archaeon]